MSTQRPSPQITPIVAVHDHVCAKCGAHLDACDAEACVSYVRYPLGEHRRGVVYHPGGCRGCKTVAGAPSLEIVP